MAENEEVKTEAPAEAKPYNPFQDLQALHDAAQAWSGAGVDGKVHKALEQCTERVNNYLVQVHATFSQHKEALEASIAKAATNGKTAAPAPTPPAPAPPAS